MTDLLGSTLFRLTWKERVTPSGRRICALRASGRRTSGSGYTSWRSPTFRDWHPSKHDPNRQDSQIQLAHEAQLAAWPTPNAMEGGQTSRGGERKGELLMGGLVGRPTPNSPSGGPNTKATETHTGGMDLDGAAQLASWATPRGTDGEKGGPNQHGSKGDLMLPSQAAMASWSTPSSRDWKDTPGMSETGTNPDGSARARLDQLPRQASLTASGETPSGSPAATGSGGQLNPRFSLWLQGLPTAWACCGELVTVSRRRSQRRS
jgi:hypothetical protein